MKLILRALAPVLVLIAGTSQAFAIDWSKVPGKDVTLLYPAQLSWELLLTEKEHSGATKFLAGKDCRACHEGEEQASGKLLVGDKTFERAPIANKPGSVKATVRAAHDGENIHIRVEFAPGNQPDAGMDKQFANKLALMVDDGAVAEATRAGCWGACHDDLARMPSANGETTKYLARSRTKVSRTGGPELKPAEELAKIRASGGFLEYWQARLNAGAAPSFVDGTILEKREENAIPTVGGTAKFENNVWTVEFIRKLDAGANHKTFVPGKTYSIGLAIHAGHADKRFHYVSLERTLVLDQGWADFVAKRQ